eukprot:6486016-Amphidinium_carterae.1
MVASLRSAPSTGLVARELALDFAHAIYHPVVTQHVLGSEHGVCDALSRWTSISELPPVLLEATCVPLQQRDEHYFRTLHEGKPRCIMAYM